MSTLDMSGVSRQVLLQAVSDLIEASCKAWQIDAAAECREEHVVVSMGSGGLAISRAPEDMPFRWVIEVRHDGGPRRRTAASIVGVLRIVRQTLVPGYEPFSLRIAPVVLPAEGVAK